MYEGTALNNQVPAQRQDQEPELLHDDACVNCDMYPRHGLGTRGELQLCLRCVQLDDWMHQASCGCRACQYPDQEPDGERR